MKYDDNRIVREYQRGDLPGFSNTDGTTAGAFGDGIDYLVNRFKLNQLLTDKWDSVRVQIRVGDVLVPVAGKSSIETPLLVVLCSTEYAGTQFLAVNPDAEIAPLNKVITRDNMFVVAGNINGCKHIFSFNEGKSLPENVDFIY